MELERTLKAVVIVDNEISEPDNPNDIVYVGMIWDDSGFMPSATLVVDWVGSKDEALEAAHDMMIKHYMENYRDHVEKMEKEYGEGSWMEGWDGNAWEMTFQSFLEAAKKAGVLHDLDI